MSIYHRDNESYLDEALNSLENQTLKMNKTIIIGDGPLMEAQKALIRKYSESLNIEFIELEKNLGLANALKIGLQHVDTEWVARMDSDDISIDYRFEKQIDFLKKNPSCDILGGQINEFVVKGETIAQRRVCLKHDQIVRKSKYFSPMNHVTVMFRKSAVIKAGSYESKYTMMEDYPLWMKMIKNGCIFENLEIPLVDVRVRGLSDRRVGIKYAVTEFKMFLEFYRLGCIQLHHLLINTVIRFPLRTFARPFIKFAYSSIRDVKRSE